MYTLSLAKVANGKWVRKKEMSEGSTPLIKPTGPYRGLNAEPLVARSLAPLCKAAKIRGNAP